MSNTPQGQIPFYPYPGQYSAPGGAGNPFAPAGNWGAKDAPNVKAGPGGVYYMPESNISAYNGERGFLGEPNQSGQMAYLNMPGVQALAQAGVGQELINTGLPKEVEAAWLLQQNQINAAKSSPEYMRMLQGMQGIQDLTNQYSAGIPGFMQGQLNVGNAVQNLGLSGMAPAQMAQLQALQGFGGVTGALNPQMQNLIDTQRNSAIQAANNAAYNGLDQNLSRLSALMAGRGLDSSSVMSRGSADLMNQAAQQAEQGRLAAMQQSVQQEQNLRSLLLSQLGQQGQTAQGLGAQGLAGIQSGQGILGQYGLPAQFQQLVNMQQIPLQYSQQLYGALLPAEQQALQIAGQMPIAQGGIGALGILGGALGGLGGLAGGIGKLVTGK